MEDSAHTGFTPFNPSVSIVISTYNRAATLVAALGSLRRQTYKNFEVIVVNGPSTDDTVDVLRQFAKDAIVTSTKNRNLSESRNIGIASARGEIIAFLDDDAVADPNWLRDLVAPYADDSVGGVGGLVYDHTGAKLQYRYSACYRRGETTFQISPPFDRLTVKGADPFLYIQGTNCSFRRTCLEKIGGFNEQIEYYHDETDVCMRIIDLGFTIQSLDVAAVIHRYAPSHVRNDKRVVFDPYTTVKNQHLFAIQNGRLTQPMHQIYSSLGYYTNTVREGGRWHFKQGHFSSDQLSHFLDRVDQAVRDGVAAGYANRRSVNFPPINEDIRPFVTHRAKKPLNIVYVTQELPPGTIGGIGRFTLDLARAMARAGHVVHIVTRGDEDRIDFEDGVYTHFVRYLEPSEKALQITPLAWTLAHLFSIQSYLTAMSARFDIDIVSGPIWLAEALFSNLSKRWPTVLTLHTTMKTIVDLHPNEADRPESKALIALEALAYRTAGLVQANSEAVRLKSELDYGAHPNVVTVPHGIEPVLDLHHRSVHSRGRLKILFVGRVELRKGVDVLLRAIEQLLPETNRSSWPGVEFLIAGPASMNTSVGDTFENWFSNKRADLIQDGLVKFLGEVSAEALEELYLTSDIFVLPSRFESFGLVLLEAMRYGLPVIASGASGMAEVVNERYGRLFEPGDHHALANSILELAKNEKMRKQLAKEALLAAQTKFNIDAIAATVQQAYYELCSRRNPQLPDKNLLEEMEFVAQLSPILEIPFAETRELVAELYKPLSAETRLNALLRSITSDSNQKFFVSCYRLILGRDYEQLISEEAAAENLRAHSTRSGFVSSMLQSDEARASPFAMELYRLWHH